MSLQRNAGEAERHSLASIAFYNEDTIDPVEPDPPLDTDHSEPVTVDSIPRQTRASQVRHRLRSFYSFAIDKISQIVALALTVLLLLFITRFILLFFGITRSQFAHLVYLITDPLVAPFYGIHRPLSYNGFTIDISTIVAVLIYIVVVMIIRRLLSILVTRSRYY
jgi:YggT family protein